MNWLKTEASKSDNSEASESSSTDFRRPVGTIFEPFHTGSEETGNI